MTGGKTQSSYGQPAGYGQPPAGYGQPQGGYGAAPPAYGQSAAAAGPYGSQPGGASPYGPVSTGYGQTHAAVPTGYGAPPASSGYATQSSMSGGYGAPPAYGAPSGYGATGGYGGGYGQPQQYPPPPQGYGAPSGAGFPPGTDPAVVSMFQQADVDRSGSIDAYELGRVLSQGRAAFSPRTLRLILHLFADNRNDTSRIGPVGFAKLWKEIQQWQKKFHEFDRDNSGSIEVAELQAALMSFNFNIPPAILQMLVSKYDVTGGSRSIGYDNFVECGFIVKGLTEKFRDQDKALTGNATFDYTSFMLMVIPFVAA